MKKDIVQAVYASGKIYPVNYVRIASKTNGYISKILVKTGDTVKAGQPLLIVSAPNNDVNIDMARTNLQLTEANNNTTVNQLNAALQDVQAAAAKYSLDSTNYERYKNLWSENITTKQNLDQAQTLAELSLRAYKKARSSYDNLRLRLSTDVSLAQQQLRMQQNNKTDYTITAPFSGKVYYIPVKEGQLLTTGMPAIDFGNASGFEAWLDVDESDIGNVALGQPVIISCDAYPDKPINTIIREIEPAIAAGTKTITAKASVENIPGFTFYSSMSVEANIITGKKTNAMVIPVEYLQENNKVMLKDKTLKTVQVGIRDAEYAEIISGIDSSTEIIAP